LVGAVESAVSPHAAFGPQTFELFLFNIFKMQSVATLALLAAPAMAAEL
jgi:hypothetical protein